MIEFKFHHTRRKTVHLLESRLQFTVYWGRDMIPNHRRFIGNTVLLHHIKRYYMEMLTFSFSISKRRTEQCSKRRESKIKRSKLEITNSKPKGFVQCGFSIEHKYKWKMLENWKFNIRCNRTVYRVCQVANVDCRCYRCSWNKRLVVVSRHANPI